MTVVDPRLDRKDYPIVHCKCCGNSQQATYVKEVVKELVDNSWCYTCRYWEKRTEHCRLAQLDLLAGKWPRALVLVQPSSGEIRRYSVAKELPLDEPMRGYGGDKHVIEFLDGRRMCSSNLWSGEAIPSLRRGDPAFKVMGQMVNMTLDQRRAEYQRLFALGHFYNENHNEEE